MKCPDCGSRRIVLRSIGPYSASLECQNWDAHKYGKEFRIGVDACYKDWRREAK